VHIALALRAVVLERSGKPEEALAAASEVAAQTPTDEHVLHTLTLVWKATGRPEARRAPAPPRRAPAGSAGVGLASRSTVPRRNRAAQPQRGHAARSTAARLLLTP
jgi:hypothetical protein